MEEMTCTLLAIHAIDMGVIGGYLIGVVALGVWIGQGQKGVSDYLLGGRDIPWWALLGSIVATETSTATFLSVPGISFAAGGDFRFLQLAMGYIIGRWLIVVLFMPHYFRGDLFTVYEVLDRRFGGLTKQTASVLFLVTRNLGDGLRLFLAAIVLERIVGWSLATCVLLLGLATIIYTVFGGMKSVVWNDCLQFVIYTAGGILSLLVIVQALPGGWSQLLEFAESSGKLRLFDFSWDYHEHFTFQAGVLGGMFLTLGTHGTDQMMVQRYLCARNPRDAARALVLSGFVVFFQFGFFLVLGIGLACFYLQFPPSTPFRNDDQVFGAFIVDHLPVGLVGLTLSAVFAAAMSTLSSSLNSSASAAVNDLYLPLAKSRPSPSRLLAMSRNCTVLFGVIQIAVGIGAQYFANRVVLDVLAIAGFTAGIMLGVFLLGVLTRRVGQTAALVGMIGGLAAVTWAKIELEVAWTWFALIGALTTFMVGLLTSTVWPRPPPQTTGQGKSDSN